MASKQRKLSLTQLQEQLETWEKMQPDIYEDIISSAKARGIVLKSGKISKSKKKQKQVASFTSEYQNKYGSLLVNSDSLNQIPFGWEEEVWPWDRRGL